MEWLTSSRSRDGIVETTSAGLGVFAYLSGFADDSQVGCCNAREVRLVDLKTCVSGCSFQQAMRDEHTGNLEFTSSKALPATPPETLNSSYV